MEKKATKKKPKVPRTRKTADPEMPRNKRHRKTAAQRRIALRDELWPHSLEEVWERHTSDGWTTFPRLISLVTVLIRELSNSGDPSSAYIELWSRVYDEGLVQIKNELEHAYAAGYSGNRATRTWRERLDVLEDLGFIKIKPNGAQKYGYVLIVNPLLVASRLKKQLSTRVPDEWWLAFRSRGDEIGADIPSPR